MVLVGTVEKIIFRVVELMVLQLIEVTPEMGEQDEKLKLMEEGIFRVM